VINDPRNRERIRRAIEALQLVGDDYQAHTNYLASLHVTSSSNHNWPGQLLKTSRTTDTIERVLGELHGLLDHPPGVGGAQHLRPVPDPPRELDGQPQPRLAVAAAGDPDPAAA
jgi:hypothetical protein